MKKIALLSIAIIFLALTSTNVYGQQWWPTTSPAVYNPYTGTYIKQYRLAWVPQTTTTIVTPAPVYGFRWLRRPTYQTTTTYNIQPIPFGNFTPSTITYGPNGGVNVYNYNY